MEKLKKMPSSLLSIYVAFFSWALSYFFIFIGTFSHCVYVGTVSGHDPHCTPLVWTFVTILVCLGVVGILLGIKGVARNEKIAVGVIGILFNLIVSVVLFQDIFNGAL